jgi:hypothetical protein
VPVTAAATSFSSPQGTLPQALLPQPASAWKSVVTEPGVRLICEPVTLTVSGIEAISEPTVKLIC